jgi:hypothetical protein
VLNVAHPPARTHPRAAAAAAAFQVEDLIAAELETVLEKVGSSRKSSVLP